MATVIQGQGTQPNEIGRGFGTGLGQGLTALIQKKQQEENQKKLTNQLEPILQSVAAQRGMTPESTSMLSQILSQNPNQVIPVLASLGGFGEKESNPLDTEEQKARIEKIKADVEKTKAPKEPTKFAGFDPVSGKRAVGSKEELVNQGMVISNTVPKDIQNKQRFKNRFKDIVDPSTLGDNDQMVYPNLESAATLLGSNKPNFVLKINQSRHYPQVVVAYKGEFKDVESAPPSVVGLSKTQNDVTNRVYKELLKSTPDKKDIPDYFSVSDKVAYELNKSYEIVTNKNPKDWTDRERKLVSGNPEMRRKLTEEIVSKMKNYIATSDESLFSDSKIDDNVKQIIFQKLATIPPEKREIALSKIKDGKGRPISDSDKQAILIEFNKNLEEQQAQKRAQEGGIINNITRFFGGQQ